MTSEKLENNNDKNDNIQMNHTTNWLKGLGSKCRSRKSYGPGER